MREVEIDNREFEDIDKIDNKGRQLLNFIQSNI